MPITDYVEEDYGSERDRIKRMLAQAAILRAKGQQEAPDGKMLPTAMAGQPSFYVKPHALQYAAPLVSQFMGIKREREADAAQRGLDERMQGSYDQWIKDRPQTRTVQTSEEMPGTEAPGPMPEGSIGPLPKVRAVMEKREPTREESIDWAARGMKNPLSKSIAAAYMEDQLVKAPERDEARQFKHDEAELQRIALNQRHAETLKAKLDGLNIEMGRKDISEANKLNIARMQDATKRELGLAEAKARVDAAGLKAKASGEKVKPVPNNVITKMTEAEQASEAISQVFSTFKPEYVGIPGTVQGMIGKLSPWTTDDQDKAAAWQNQYKKLGELVERHGLFGSAFTPGEKSAWDSATFSLTDNPQKIATNLKIRAELAAKHYNALRDRYVTSGYGAIGEAFQPTGVNFEGIAPTTQLPVQQQQQAAPPPQQRRRKNDLPPGVTIVPE